MPNSKVYEGGVRRTNGKNKLLRFNEAAKIIGITKQAVTYAIQQGWLATEDVGGEVRLIRMSEAERYKAARQATPHKRGWPKGKPWPQDRKKKEV